LRCLAYIAISPTAAKQSICEMNSTLLSLASGAIIQICVTGWQLRPWARLSSPCRRGDNVAVEPREVSGDMPDFPEVTPWLAVAARRWDRRRLAAFNGAACVLGTVSATPPRHIFSTAVVTTSDHRPTRAITVIHIPAIRGITGTTLIPQ